MAKKKEIQHPEYEKAPMDRRTFFRRIAAAGTLGGAVGYASLAPSNWPLSLKDTTGLRSVPKINPFTLKDFRVPKPASISADVGIARGTPNRDGTFSPEQYREMLAKAIDAIGGLRHYIKKDDIVMVKPNVAFDRSPNLGATSNPHILEALIRMILVECQAQEVRVADNPIESPPDCFEKSKILHATQVAGGRVYLPDSNAFKVLHTPGAVLIKEWSFFHRPFTNVDKVIGFAPVKDHNLCNSSMGIKNWYGLLGGTRNQFHQDIHEIVSDLSVMMRPTLTILDGTNVLMENGPTGGDPSNVKKGDLVLAGVDPVALDAYAFEHCLERGRDYPRYLYMAEAKGSGKLDWTGRVKEISG
ncbi:MAG: DUF362 domain-containing protein [Candidatus Hydrogenedentes bacterium]|nr:DUF362 domain-containing protein [Candidatus Hydrogenedentota bacterium]